MDSFHQYLLGLESVTFRLHVKFMVQVFVDFICFTVFAQHTAKYTSTANPQDLLWHTCFSGTLSLTETSVATLGFRFKTTGYAGARVDDVWFLDY